MEEKNYEISLKEILGMLIPKIWIIAIVAIICSVIVGIYSMFTVENQYSVNMKYCVKKAGSDGYQQSTQDINYAISIIPSIKEAYISGVFHEKIADNLQKQGKYLNYSFDALSNYIGAMINFAQNSTSNAPTYIITINSNDKLLSQDVAAVIHDFTVNTIDENVHYSEIQHLVAVSSFTIETYNNPSAVFISKSVKTETIKRAAIAFALSILVSSVIIVSYGIFDPTVRDKNKLAREVNAPVLGVIPRF